MLSCSGDDSVVFNIVPSDAHCCQSLVIDWLKSQRSDCSNPHQDLSLIRIQFWWSFVLLSLMPQTSLLLFSHQIQSIRSAHNTEVLSGAAVCRCCFLQVWCHVVVASLWHLVLWSSGLHDPLSCTVLMQAMFQIWAHSIQNLIVVSLQSLTSNNPLPLTP